jgi:tyrosinase
VELVGANRGTLAITGSGVSTTVNLDPGVRRQVSASLAAAGETGSQPDRVMLNLENVRGVRDASVLNVYVNVPQGAAASGDQPGHLAGSVALFGLRRASSTDGRHGGQGLSFVLDITDLFDTLHLDNALNVDSLQVKIVPHQPVPEQAEITVGRVSVYRQGADR